MTELGMADNLYRGFWCFETLTETDKGFAKRMALKNAIKFCMTVLESDPSREHLHRTGPYQNRLEIDRPFWESVQAILSARLKGLPV